MKKKYVVIGASIIIVLLVVAAIYKNSNNPNNIDKTTSSNANTISNNNEKKINTNKIRKSVFFKKDNKSVVIGPEIVAKDNTNNKMLIEAQCVDASIKKNIQIKVYQDDKVIYDDFASEEVITVPFKMDKSQVSFKIELNYKAELNDEDEKAVNIIWFTNSNI